jgi:hypothetical protein
VTNLSKIGVDLADVADLLERQGVDSFAQSWDELIKSVQKQLENAGAQVTPPGAVTPTARGGGYSRGASGGCAVEDDRRGGPGLRRNRPPRRAFTLDKVVLGRHFRWQPSCDYGTVARVPDRSAYVPRHVGPILGMRTIRVI